MNERITQLIEEKRAAIVAAVATLDQIVQDQRTLQDQAKALERRSLELQQAQQAAALEKIKAQAALVELERLIEITDKK